MTRPTRLNPNDVDAWIAKHPGWERDEKGIFKRFTFPDFSSALAFVVRVGCLAEKKDHHPDIELTWGRCRVAWSTHDAGGVTELDLAAAEGTDSLGG
ncbi:MAG TPA: 4a-hydroxytetrahydrobiopterin dehydratase [Polyangiaceae bacterium]